MKPMSTRIFPSLSPRSFCNSSAFSKSSGSIWRRSMSIWPRRIVLGSGCWVLGSVTVVTLELLDSYGGFARVVAQQLLALGLHQDLARQAGVVFPLIVE